MKNRNPFPLSDMVMLDLSICKSITHLGFGSRKKKLKISGGDLFIKDESTTIYPQWKLKLITTNPRAYSGSLPQS